MGHAHYISRFRVAMKSIKVQTVSISHASSYRAPCREVKTLDIINFTVNGQHMYMHVNTVVNTDYFTFRLKA